MNGQHTGRRSVDGACWLSQPLAGVAALVSLPSPQCAQREKKKRKKTYATQNQVLITPHGLRKG